MPVTTAAAAIGLVMLAIGSIGPWATVLAISIAGTHGDGKITLGLAVVAAGLLATRSRNLVALAAVAMLAAIGVAAYDLAHIERATTRAVIFGVHAASAGWGVYLVIVSAAVAGCALVTEYVNTDRL